MNIVKHLVALSALADLFVGCTPVETPAPTPVPAPTAVPTAAASTPAPEVPPDRCAAPEVDEETKACLSGATPAKCVTALARARIARGEDQAAVDALTAVIAKSPKEHTPFLELALLLQTNNRYDLASTVLEKAKQSAQKPFLVHYLLASNYAAQRKMKESIAELRKAHEVAPTDPDVWVNLALSLTKMEPPELDEAKELLQKFGQKYCTGQARAAQCSIAAHTLERIAGTKPWPPKRQVPLTLAAMASCPDGVIKLPDDPIRKDSMFTVWGASHHLRSKPHRKAVTTGPITVVGYVVAHNYDQAPACAIHRAGKSTPEDCVAPMPTFYIADQKTEPTSYIPVMGWASTWSLVYEMMVTADKGGNTEAVMDPYTAKSIPHPIPSVGAKVEVTGNYGFSSPVGASNPRFGILSFESMKVAEPAKEKATLPGISRR